MNKVAVNSGFKGRVLPILVACVVLVLIMLTVPMTFIPAKVMGGYASIGTIGFTTPDQISIGAGGSISITVSGANVGNLNLQSITFGGAHPTGFAQNQDGTLTLTFAPGALNLTTGTTSIAISGTLNDGTPFSGTVPVSVVQ